MSLLKAEKILLIIIKSGIYLTLLTPLVVLPWIIFPFVFGKAVFFQSIIEIVLAAYLILIIIAPRYRPQKSLLLFAVGLYFASLVLATFVGVDWRKSFWGNEERMSGFLILLHFFAFFVVASSVFRSRQEWRRLISWSVIISLAVAAFAFFWRVSEEPYFGIDLGDRFAGTLGNSIFLANYALFQIFFCALLIVEAATPTSRRGVRRISPDFGRGTTTPINADPVRSPTSNRSRTSNGVYQFFLFFALILNIFVLFLTHSRGALLALFAAVFIFSGFYIFTARGKLRVGAALLLVFLILTGAGTWLGRDLTFIKSFPVLNRLAEINWRSGTGRTRLMMWGVALQSWMERPVFGWGPENFKIAFNKYYRPEFLEHSYYETWVDRPHNAILEVANNTGIIGLTAYLSIFLAVGFALFRLLKQGLGNNRGAVSIFLALFAAYFIQNLFVFDTPSSYLMFFLVLAFIVCRSRSAQITAPTGQTQKNTEKFLSGSTYFEEQNRRLSASIFMVGIPSLFLLASVYYLNILPALSSNAMYKANVIAYEDIEKGIAAYQNAQKFPTPYKEEWRAELAKAAILALGENKIARLSFAKQNLGGQNLGGLPKIASIVDFSAQELEKNILEHPKNTYNYYLMARLYTIAGLYEPGYFRLAEKYFKQSLELSPKRQQVLFGLGKMKFLSNELDEAEKVFRQTLVLDPKIAEAHWYLGLVLEEKDKTEEADREFLKALELRYRPGNEKEISFILQNFLPIFVENAKYDILENIYRAASELEPQNAAWRAQLAVVLKLRGKLEKARREAEKAAELDPSYREEAKLFLEQLE